MLEVSLQGRWLRAAGLIVGVAAIVAAPAAADHGGLHVDDLTESEIGPSDLAEALAGEGVAVDEASVEFTGDDRAAGAFTGGGGVFDFAEGITLGTGRVTDVVGPNELANTATPLGQDGDDALDDLATEMADANATTFDAAVLEFEFDVGSDVDEVVFQYVFGSEEYNEFVGSDFNDVFAFWVNDENCAVVPDPEDGEQPVAVNTVNNGKPPDDDPVNSDLYINNDPENPDHTGETVDEADLLDTEMDGLTETLECRADVAAGSNSIRLAIADTDDDHYDSWVLLEGGSLDVAPPEPGDTTARVQDLLLIEEMRTLDDDNEDLDVTEAVVDHLASLDADPVELAGGVTFTPTDALDPRVVDRFGEEREDVDLIAGLVEDGEDAQAFALLGTPEDGSFIRASDDFQFFFDDVDDDLVNPGDPLFGEYAFVQAVPAGDDADNGLDPVDLLAERVRAGTLNVFSVADDDGEGQWGTLVDQPWRTFEGSDGAEIPPKAEPLTDGLRDGAWEAREGGLSGVKDLLDSIAEGAEESLENIFGGDGEDMGDNQRCADPPCDPDPPPPPSPDCIGDCGRSTGDPHLETFDGEGYDMQAVGEFVAAKSDELEVQLRTRQVGDRPISVNSGVGIGVGGQEVAVLGRHDADDYTDWSPVYVDGEAVDADVIDAEGEVDLDDGSTLSFHGRRARVETPEGHLVTVHGVGKPTLTKVYVTEGADTEWEGLFGDGDGDADNDFTTRDGEDVGPDPDFEQLYDEFVDSWRVDDAASLFVYPDGLGTDDYTDLNVPDEPFGVGDLDDGERQRAEAVCEEAGITDDDVLVECILDYAITGDMAFVVSNRQVDTIEGFNDGRIEQVEGGDEPDEPADRIAGDGRIETSVEVSQQFQSADTVVLATASDYPDSLAGAPLASQRGAPILLTSPDSLADAVVDELERLDPETAVLLGGEAALGPGVEDDLEQLGIGDIERFAGVHRFATAAQIAHEVLAEGPDDLSTAYVVEGEHSDPERGWPDAVAVSGLAAFETNPILLVKHDEVPLETTQAAEMFTEFTIVGGEGAVSEDVAEWFEGLEELAEDEITVDRVGGLTRYDTSARLGDLALNAGVDPNAVYLATGGNWPDSLSAAPLAGATAADLAVSGGVLLLVDSDDLAQSPQTRAWLEDNSEDVDTVTAVGGPAAISTLVLDDAQDLVE